MPKFICQGSFPSLQVKSQLFQFSRTLPTYISTLFTRTRGSQCTRFALLGRWYLPIIPHGQRPRLLCRPSMKSREILVAAFDFCIRFTTSEIAPSKNHRHVFVTQRIEFRSIRTYMREINSERQLISYIIKDAVVLGHHLLANKVVISMTIRIFTNLCIIILINATLIEKFSQKNAANFKYNVLMEKCYYNFRILIFMRNVIICFMCLWKYINYKVII